MVQTGEYVASTDAERYLLIYMVVVLVVITALVIVFFLVFQRRKNKLLLEKIRERERFEKAIAGARLEIQEQTLRNVGQELHDNIGQLLSYTNMQLNLLGSVVKDSAKTKLENTQSSLKDAIQEVRTLSKSLNRDVIADFGFLKSLENEVDRINRLGKIKAKLNSPSAELGFRSKEDEIILFRIIQEFISNSLKYSEAEHIIISVIEQADHFQIQVSDDGKGFDKDEIEAGSGLINMRSRAQILGALLTLDSSPGNGVRLKLNYPKI